jgi:hypothetical protein
MLLPAFPGLLGALRYWGLGQHHPWEGVGSMVKRHHHLGQQDGGWLGAWVMSRALKGRNAQRDGGLLAPSLTVCESCFARACALTVV